MQGKFDPYKSVKDAELPEFMPRRGTQHDMQLPATVSPLLTHLQLAKALRARMGSDWQPENFQWLQAEYPDGAREDELADVERKLRKPVPALKVVGGKS